MGPRLALGRLGSDGVGIIAFVGKQDIIVAEVVGQRIGLGALGDLTAGQPTGRPSAS